MPELRFTYYSWAALLSVACIGVMVLGLAGTSFSDAYALPENSRTALQALSVVNIIATPALCWWLYRREMAGRHQVVLGAEAMTTPRGGFSSAKITLPYSQITGTELFQLKNSVSLRIATAARTVVIPRSALPSDEDFLTLHAAVQDRVAKAKT